MVIKAESVQEQGLRAGLDVMAAGDAEAAEAVGSRRRKKVQTELSGEHVASKELCAGTVSPAEEADGKLGGARRAVKKTKKAAVKKKKGTCAGAVSTTEEAAGKLGGNGTAPRKKKSARRPESRTEFRGVSRKLNGKYGAQITRSKGTALWLGSFDTAEDAARAYDAAAVELHGASAVTNFKPSGESSGQAEGSVKMMVKSAAARPDARTELRGVSRTAKGKYYAQIWDSKLKSMLKLGTFGTAVEATMAYDAAAVEMRGASALTNFMASGELSGQATAGSVKMEVKKPPTAKPDRTEFRGVHRLPSGLYRARIYKGKSVVSLGRFARAFDAAAVNLRGAEARTNFDQLPTAARTMFEQKLTAAAADDGEVSSMDFPNDFPELPAPDFLESLIPGPHMDDLRTDLTPADWQLVHEFLKDFDQVVA